MANGTINGTTNNQYIESKIVWSSYKVANTNTSKVTAALYYRRTNTGYITSGTGTFSIKIGDAATTMKTLSLSISTEWVKAVEATSTITHNADGSKQITITGTGSISGTTFDSTSCSGTATLDTIAAHTLLSSISGFTEWLDDGFEFTLTSRSTYYTRTRIYVLSPGGDYILLRTTNYGQIGRDKTRTPEIILSTTELSQIYNVHPDTIQTTVIVEVGTYTNAAYTNQFGSIIQGAIRLYIPRSVAPKVSLNVSPVNSNSWFKGKGLYVAGYSGLTAALSAEPGAGAVLSSSSIVGGEYSSQTNTLTVNKLLKPEQFTLTGTAIDSRARSGIATQDITVESYSIPAIYDVSVTRGKYTSATAAWVADDNGPDVRVYFRTSLALAGHGNTYTASFSLDGAAKTPDTGNPVGLKPSVDYAFHFLNMDSERSHSLVISATDLVGYSGAASITVPTTQVTIEFRENGKGIAFGKTSEKDAFECAMPAEFTGGMTIDGREIDVVIEEGKKDFWTYRKWSDGLLECWGITNAVTLSFDGTAGLGCWYGTIAPSFNFPTNAAGKSMFIDIPTVQQACDAGSAIIVSTISHVDSEKVNLAYGRFYGGNDNKEVNFHFYVRGKWK